MGQCFELVLGGEVVENNFSVQLKPKPSWTNLGKGAGGTLGLEIMEVAYELEYRLFYFKWLRILPENWLVMLSVSCAGKNAYGAGKTSWVLRDGASGANRCYVLAHCGGGRSAPHFYMAIGWYFHYFF